MSSEKMVDALEAFGSVFIPFYFFAAGTHVERDELGWMAAAVAVGLLLVVTPVRIFAVAAHRRLALREPFAQSRRIGIALVPTLVFTLVLSTILRANFAAPDWLVGALVLYTVLNTLLPAFVLRGQAPEFTEPVAEPTAELEAPMP
jgi:Kef-type K+ transport system membrane component KefB